MPPLLIIKTGQPDEAITRRFGSFEDWTLARAGLSRDEAQIVSVFQGEPLPDPSRVSGAIITGSPAMVTERTPWMERTAAWLRRAVPSGLPVLGICFGHQLLAQALGGRAGDNPRGREIGTVEVRLLDAAGEDPLLGGLPDPLTVHVTHVQSALTLPPAATRLAGNGHEPNHAFRAALQAWGLQFHPEFTADIMRALIAGHRETLLAEGLDPDELLSSVRDSAVGRTILGRFAAIAQAHTRA